MNVVCGRCSTAYEFDDALVAKRGTTVKCSRCGHQFRVFPNAGQPNALPDRWLVRRPTGQILEFAELRELQQALGVGSVTVSDELSRDGKLFRPIHAVPELESFLPDELPRVPAERTLTGMPPAEPPVSSSASTVPGQRVTHDLDDDDDITAVYSAEQLAQMRRAALNPTRSKPPALPPRPVGRSAPPTIKTPTFQKPASKAPPLQVSKTPPLPSFSKAPPIQTSASSAGSLQPGAPPLQRSLSHAPPIQGSASKTPIQNFAPAAQAPEPPKQSLPNLVVTPTLALRRRGSGRRSLSQGTSTVSAPTSVNPEPDAADHAQPTPLEESQLEFVPTSPPTNRGLRWVLGLLLLGGLGLVAATLGREYLEPYLQPPADNQDDARIDSMLSLGHELYRQDDFEGAKEQFDRASGLSETHPGVLGGQLLIQLTRADSLWLLLRLLPEDSPERDATNAQLSEQIEKLRVISERAIDTASNAPELTALILDSYRIRGQQAAARKRAGELSAHATEPRTAYVLAMLDLADEEPVWATVIERLRTALGVERSPGRAGAALVYALARSGDLETARIELEKLRTASKQHPLYEPLAAFVERPSEARADEAAPTTQQEQEQTSTTRPRKDGEALAAGDPMQLAQEARAAGDYARAERYYQQALERQPGNVQALTGLGDTARARGNQTVALSHYQAALRVSPGHLPALAAAADLYWSRGERAEAVQHYRRVGSGNAYSARAAARIAEFEGGAAAPKDTAPGSGDSDTSPRTAPQETPPSAPPGELETP